MATPKTQFLQAANKKAFDVEHRKRINFNIAKYKASVYTGMNQFADVTLARERAAFVKRKVVENLDKYLIEWESNFKKNGGKVIWAQDAAEANKEILAILKKHNVKSIVKSKSMVTEEIKLNDFLAHNNIEPIETDLGEYIQQLDGEPPYHIVTPAMHKSKEDIAKLFHEKFGTPLDFTPQELTLKAREILRQKYVEAGAGFTGANFLLADTGGVHMLENEGNGRLSAAFPKVHIVVTGIEKILPSVNDLALFLPMLSTFGTGQKICNYNTIYTGPKKRFEIDGPEEMYVVLLDNGRSDLLAQVPQREALACIRCGACLNACPVYKNIGGHTYGKTYSGPIGSVITPYYNGFKNYVHLSYASSLCGNCTEVCPVNIDLHKYLLYNRQKAVESNYVGRAEKLTWFMWRKGMLNRNMMNRGNGTLKSIMFRTVFSGSWGKHRAPVKFSAKTFNEEWKEKFAVKK
ncbi:MAG: iron-sulfur cluster-binding protein [Sphingobacteriales bacterium]|nr:MAG: iron-sulfur cluster-binding protein [Sphingobacteriales bacterium]